MKSHQSCIWPTSMKIIKPNGTMSVNEDCAKKTALQHWCLALIALYRAANWLPPTDHMFKYSEHIWTLPLWPFPAHNPVGYATAHDNYWMLTGEVQQLLKTTIVLAVTSICTWNLHFFNTKDQRIAIFSSAIVSCTMICSMLQMLNHQF